MLIFHTYARMWPMLIGVVALFAVLMGLISRVRIARLERPLRSRRVFWSCLISWLVLASACLTMIDEPYFEISQEIKNWMFMLSAFLGIPLTMPLLAGLVWAWQCRLRGESVMPGALASIMLAAFWLGCAASNVHDIIWCGAITKGFTQHFGAGSDILFFIAPAKWFGIPESVSADYAALGSFAIIFVMGELAVAAVSFARLARSYGQRLAPDPRG